ncbi:uncharacterized protein METZ01_LOCUS123084 [marine metagenome]|uniref:Zinc-ribbon domain-containing protein n=1 Tax=marine metagenome TaxID=408172 RepID=A0A381Y021_9ZZZZ
MKCATCGNDNPAEASFCQDCGNSLSGYTAGGPTRQGMVSFPDAVKLGFQRCIEFTGRSTRAEYWWWSLFYLIAIFTTALIDGLIGMYGILYWISFVGLLIPCWAVLVRRLHDTNKTGLWSLLVFVPFGGLILLVFALQASDIGTNKYGPNPMLPISLGQRNW